MVIAVSLNVNIRFDWKWLCLIIYATVEFFMVDNFRKLVPSFANPETWRNSSQAKKLEGNAWKMRRLEILERDNYTCQYCGYRSEKYQIAHHIDGNPENNEDENLTTICQMCNLIEHAGQGCVVQGVVDLYKKSKFPQNDIIRITREMRDNGKSDEEIIKFLGLKVEVPFMMDKSYLEKLFGFVTSRPTRYGNEMFDKWKTYHQSQVNGKRM